MKYDDVTVIIPTLNEEKNISIIIGLIKKLYNGINILVVDDGSKDKTQKNVRKSGVKLLDRSKKKIKGLTSSIIDGVKLVKTKYIVVMDADLQHPPEKIKEILLKLRNGYEIVIATRKKILKWSLFRRVVSKIAVIFGRIRLLLKGMYVNDPVSGFFGVRTKFVKEVLDSNEERFEKEGYKILFDILKYCGKVNIGKVYFEFKCRERDSSKIGKKHVLVYLRSLFK